MKGKEWKSDNTKPPSLTRDIFFSYSISDYFLPNDVGQVWKWGDLLTGVLSWLLMTAQALVNSQASKTDTEEMHGCDEQALPTTYKAIIKKHMV